MTSKELENIRFELNSKNKEWISMVFYNPFSKFLVKNQTALAGEIRSLGIADVRKIPGKADMIDLVIKMYTHEKISKAYFEAQTELNQQIIMRCVWDGGLDRDALEGLVKKSVLVMDKGRYFYQRVELIPELQADWRAFTTILEPHGFYDHDDDYLEFTNLSLTLPRTLCRLLSIHLPKPAHYELAPFANLSEAYTVYRIEEVIFEELPRILTYHGQGKIKYTTKGYPNQAAAKKITKSIKLKELCREFEFPLRGLMLAGVLSPQFKLKAITDPPEKIISGLFASGFNRRPVAPFLLPHLKGLSSVYPGDFIPNTTLTIFSVFRQLPEDLWITFENIATYVSARFFDIMPLENRVLIDKVRAEFEETEEDGIRQWSLSLYPANLRQFVWKPYLAGHIYLLAAFGLMDIATDPLIFTQNTPYDGLYAFRLTKLGAYVLGIRQVYTPPQSVSKTSLAFDDSSPIIRIEGDVLLADTMLGNYATRVSDNRYQFSPGKFLKDCKSTKDIQNKIALFRQTVGQTLPPFWEGYLQELVENSKSFTAYDLVRVFKIPAGNKTLQRLLAQDDELRKLIIKAEHYHIIVPEINLTAFNNRMKELGYVIGR